LRGHSIQVVKPVIWKWISNHSYTYTKYIIY